MTLARTTRWTFPLLLALAAPAAAQEGPPPGPGGPPPEVVERLDRVRMERMKEALDLTEEETRAIATRMREHRERMREAMEGQREAMERLRSALRSDPVDQSAIARSMEAMERQREALEALRERQREELGEGLTPEKRAKLMFFNERFDQRLRELMARRRMGGPGDPGPGPGMRPGPGLRGPGMAGPGGPEEAAAVRERISRLEAELDRLRRHLEELEQ